MPSSHEFVRKSFESEQMVEEYAEVTSTVGLWLSERLLIDRFFSITDRVLDIGCGAGRTTFGLASLGFRSLLGVDFAEPMIRRATAIALERGVSIVFEVGDATKLRFPESSFDAVLFSHNGLMTIPTYGSRVAALKNIHRVLRRGGIFIFSTHDRDVGEQWRPFWLEEELRWKQHTQDPQLAEFGDQFVESRSGQRTFVHFPSRSEVAAVLVQCGFTIVQDGMRSELCDENETVRATTSDCRMWVVRK